MSFHRLSIALKTNSLGISIIYISTVFCLSDRELLPHLWTDFLEIGTKISQIFRRWRRRGVFSFTPPPTHAITHLLIYFHIYGSILSKLVPKFCKFFGDRDVVVFFSFTPPPTHPHTQSHIYWPRITHLWTDFLEIGTKILQIFRRWRRRGLF